MKKSKHLPLIISLLSFGAVICALIIQYYFQLNPCVICIIARYILLIIGLFSFISYCLSYLLPRKYLLQYLSMGISSIASLTGLYYSLKHIHIVNNKIETCSIDPLQSFLDNIFLSQSLPFVFQATGSCLDSNFIIMGISFTFLTLAIYIIIISLLAIYWFKAWKNN